MAIKHQSPKQLTFPHPISMENMTPQILKVGESHHINVPWVWPRLWLMHYLRTAACLCFSTLRLPVCHSQAYVAHCCRPPVVEEEYMEEESRSTSFPSPTNRHTDGTYRKRGMMTGREVPCFGLFFWLREQISLKEWVFLLTVLPEVIFTVHKHFFVSDF